MAKLRSLLAMVSRHRLAALATLTSVALVVGLGALVMSMNMGSDEPKSRYGDPALDAIVALPEQLYSPPTPDESSRDAAKRVKTLVTSDLFAAMSSPRERETNYRMAVVAHARPIFSASWPDRLAARPCAVRNTGPAGPGRRNCRP